MVSSQPVIFDRICHRAHRSRAAALGPSTFLIDRVADDLCDRLAAVLRRFEFALDIGTPTDAVRRVLAASGKVGTIIAADALAGTAAFRHLSDSRGKCEAQFCIAADEEALKDQEVLHLISPGLITQKRELIEREREWVSALEKSLL